MEAHDLIKGLCLERANELGVRHAQLPIGQYVEHMPSRKVLTVNHVRVFPLVSVL